MVAQVVKRAGRTDVLDTIADILLMKRVHETSTAEWDRVFNVNVRGTFFGTRAVVPAMRQAGGGSIINISSVYGLLGARSAYAYEASKGAVRLFRKAARPISPITRLCSAPPCSGAGQPQEVSAGVLFLTSDESSFVVVSELVIDGGYTAV